jgi:hypothetical protein
MNYLRIFDYKGYKISLFSTDGGKSWTLGIDDQLIGVAASQGEALQWLEQQISQ